MKKLALLQFDIVFGSPEKNFKKVDQARHLKHLKMNLISLFYQNYGPLDMTYQDSMRSAILMPRSRLIFYPDWPKSMRLTSLEVLLPNEMVMK